MLSSELVLSLEELSFLYERDLASFKFLVAFSGGPDSLALLDSLNRYRESLPTNSQFKLACCHVDHNLRENSAKEASFAQTFAEELGVEIFVCEADSSTRGKQNIESWAREVRYAFLEATRKNYGFDFILTAHHRDDLAETFLFRLFSGRLSSSSHTMNFLDEQRMLFRPLLACPKYYIEEYLLKHGLSPVYDESNEDLSRTRNKIRKQIVPLLREEFNPKISEACSRLAERLNQDEEALFQVAEDYIESKGDLAYEISGLQSLHDAIRWRVLKLLAFNQVGESAQKLGFKTLSALSATLVSGAFAISEADLGFGIRVALDKSNSICFSRFETSDIKTAQIEEYLIEERDLNLESSLDLQVETKKDDEVYSLAVPGELTIHFPSEENFNQTLKAEVIKYSEVNHAELALAVSDSSENGEFFAFFDLDCFDGFDLSVRRKLPGDVINVSNRGRRKVKKLFQEKGIPLSRRALLPILCVDREILWIPTVARSKLGEISTDTENLLKLTYRVGH